MEFWLWAVIGILIFIIIGLSIKLYLIQKAAREIETEFAERLTTETNTLITLSTRDPHMKRLAASINSQLRLLRRERHRFQQGDLKLKEAITNISHDLRTPLTAIFGYLELLEQEEKSENAARYLSMIENRTEVMKQLTEDLFRYSVISSTASSAVSLQPVDLRRVLEESLVSFYGALLQKGIEPQISLPEVPVTRTLDSAALNRIFSNIISNALKYSAGDLEVSLAENGTILFANTAENLSPVEAGRLFDRFYTVESARSSTGLGLSIAKRLTEYMGGTISAEYRGKKLLIRICFHN